LSNVSNGVPDELRTWLNIPYVIMLMRNGLTSAIVDAFDKNLTDVVHGRNNNLVQLINKVADGEKVDMSKLNDLDAKYVKSAKVLMGEVLFSNAWLEV
jgi:cobalamin-dependent methionine synthase I